jgi:hypothetical protein
MTIREWWHKTAPVDILKYMAKNCCDFGCCFRRTTGLGDSKNLKCPVYPEKLPQRDICSKCMENLLNEKFEK